MQKCAGYIGVPIAIYTPRIKKVIIHKRIKNNGSGTQVLKFMK